MRRVYLAAGLISVGLALAGVALPILPTVPFLILAAWCFGKSNPAWEQRLLEHPRYGPHIRLWREKGAIARIGKLGATMAFAASIVLAFALMSWPYPLIPCALAVVMLGWIWTRPDS
ncbi:MAG: YbaN family protein [Novosphingobium sp.]|nr:YbaN family protein [Novosphingobium sp.]